MNSKDSLALDGLYKEISKFERSWIKFVEYILQIKSSNQYKTDFNCKSFKEFCKNHLSVHEKTVYKMIRSYKYILENRPERLKNSKAYIPNYGYIHYLFSSFLNQNQKRLLENMIFNKATKKEIRDMIDNLKENSMEPEKKQKQNLSQSFGFAKSFKGKITDLVNYFAHNSSLKKSLRSLEDKLNLIIANDLSTIQKKFDSAIFI